MSSKGRRGRHRARSSSPTREDRSLGTSNRATQTPDIFDQFLHDSWRDQVGQRADSERRPSVPRSVSEDLFEDPEENVAGQRKSRFVRPSTPPRTSLLPSRRGRSYSPDNNDNESVTAGDGTSTPKRRRTGNTREALAARREHDMLVGHYLLMYAESQPEAPTTPEVPEVRPISIKARFGLGQSVEDVPSGSLQETRFGLADHGKRRSVLTHDKEAGGLVQMSYSFSSRRHLPIVEASREIDLEGNRDCGDGQDLSTGFGDFQNSIGPTTATDDTHIPKAVEKLFGGLGTTTNADDLSDYEEEEPVRRTTDPPADETLGKDSDEDTHVETAEYRRWKPPPHQTYIPEVIPHPPIPKPPSATPLQERKAFTLDLILSPGFTDPTLPGGIEGQEPAIIRVRFTTFSEVWDASRELNDVLRGVETLRFHDHDISCTDDVYTDPNLREAWKAGSGMSAQVTVVDGHNYGEGRRLLSNVARHMASGGKYAMHDAQIPGVVLAIFPSVDVRMCDMLLVPGSLKGILEALIICRLKIPRNIRN
ncbi:hypothetical protein FRB94_014671 [Tulasnella sp. JGI-2019a]|nr:hypothetical protein FRB94_014671 [Tulasnella sp. JGI-2019a]